MVGRWVCGWGVEVWIAADVGLGDGWEVGVGISGVDVGISGVDVGISGVDVGISGVDVGISGVEVGISGVDVVGIRHHWSRR